MRTAFINRLFERAKADERIKLVVGDLGFGVVDEFQEQLPDQFVNAGVAEQNMVGIAAGMALEGDIVFTYSIANFATQRCLEQIRNDVCFHDIHVVVVAVGGGLVYGPLGHTHHATEDLAVMRSLPGLSVVAPGDPFEARWVTDAVLDRPGPYYLRLGRAGEPEVHAGPDAVDYRLGEALQLREGKDATLVSTGGILANVVTAAERLSELGVECRVLSFPTLKPMDRLAVLRAARETHLIVTVEEHNVDGGLGGAVAEVLAEEAASGTRLRRLGIRHAFLEEVGGQEYLRRLHGLGVEDIVEATVQALDRGQTGDQLEEMAEIR